MAININQVKKLIELLSESELSEIEVRTGDDVVRVSRASMANAVAPTVVQSPAAQSPAAPSGDSDSAGAATPPSPDDPNALKSPMVGTFYSAPDPDAKPFVKEGAKVNKGDVLCIIEAMKMMNRIEADRAGTIKSILVENAQPVEFDQPLFIIV